jgi:hypothetical protein
MESSKILNYKNINNKKYEYYPPHKTDSGVYISSCNYRLSKNEVLPFYIETPKLKTPTGIIKSGNKFYMDLELPLTSEFEGFRNFLSSLDESHINSCYKNNKDWFGKIIPLEVIENYYKSPVIFKAKGTCPLLRVRVPSYRGKPLIEVYNHKRKKIDSNYILPDDELICIIEIVGLKFLSQQFIGECELQKVKIFKSEEDRKLPPGYIFNDNTVINLDELPNEETESNVDVSKDEQKVVTNEETIESTSTYSNIDESTPNNIVNDETNDEPLDTSSVDNIKEVIIDNGDAKTNTKNENNLDENILSEIKEFDQISKDDNDDQDNDDQDNDDQDNDDQDVEDLDNIDLDTNLDYLNESDTDISSSDEDESIYSDSEYEIDAENDLNDIEPVNIEDEEYLDESNKLDNESNKLDNESNKLDNESNKLDNESNQVDPEKQKLIDEYQKKLKELEELENKLQ